MSETVGIVSIEGEGWVAFNLDDKVQAEAFVQELRDHITGALPPDHVTDDENPSHVNVAVHQKPDGWVAALPEFMGW